MSEIEDSLPKNKYTASLFSYNTEYSADSVEWCPHLLFQNFFVCANYQLSENGDKDANTTAKRLGKILLFSVAPEIGLKLHQSIDTEAVLDQKWCLTKIDDSPVLGVVNANKSLEFQNDESDHLILSLDWSTGKYSSPTPEVVCSDSKGNIHIFTLSSNKLVLENSYHGHDYEAWIAGFYYWNPNIFFSGGDDSVFLQFDRRAGDNPVAKNKRHDAGVTSFHSNKSREFIVANGSYDENITLWDVRSLKNPITTIKMPGTLWRLKWDPFSQNFLLAACMLGGVHIVDVQKSDQLTIFDSYYEHKSIAYGADWSYLKQSEVASFDSGGTVMIGTCSFYDKLLCVSKVLCEDLKN